MASAVDATKNNDHSKDTKDLPNDALPTEKKHKLTYTTNCIKKMLQKNEDVGKVKANASSIVIKFMELLTKDMLAKCNDVVQEKKAKCGNSNVSSKLNVVSQSMIKPTSESNNDGNNSGNHNQTKNKKKIKKKNGVSLRNLITIDVLHEAIKDDDRLSFMNNLITKHYPEMDEKTINKQLRAKKKELKKETMANNKTNIIKNGKTRPNRKRKRSQLIRNNGNHKLKTETEDNDNDNDSPEIDEETESEIDEEYKPNKSNTKKKNKALNSPKKKRQKLNKIIEIDEKKHGQNLRSKQRNKAKKFSFENVFGF